MPGDRALSDVTATPDTVRTRARIEPGPTQPRPGARLNARRGSWPVTPISYRIDVATQAAPAGVQGGAIPYLDTCCRQDDLPLSGRNWRPREILTCRPVVLAYVCEPNPARESWSQL